MSKATTQTRTMVGPFALPTTGKVQLQPTIGAWAVNSKGALFAAACLTGGKTVNEVLAAAPKANVTVAQAKAHLMWGWNHGWLTVTPAPTGLKPLMAEKLAANAKIAKA